ncbi:MAG: VWA domain-containing protein [Deltaproteobacteria bacterium]|nr:VWA domain-containing protein [Deltaproteobacteria bacterium]
MYRAVGIALGLLVAMLGSAARGQNACKPPRVLIVLDQSSSMVDPGVTFTGKSKWEVAKEAIAAVLRGYEGKIDFGLMLFPSPSQCGPGALKVPVGPRAGTSILRELGTAPPLSGNYTPMAQTLDKVPEVKALQDGGYRNYVLLITDGWQWCYPYDASTRFLAVNSVANLVHLGVRTHVVGFGDGVDALALNRMAEAAGTKVNGSCNAQGSDAKAKGHCYHQAGDQKELSTALHSVAAQVTAELCDGMDNDCDGKIDEDLTGPFCAQQQGVCAGSKAPCGGGEGWAACGATDYKAHAAARKTVYEATETLCDGQDNDCDGTVDEGCACRSGESRACGAIGGECSQRCATGSWGSCTLPGTSSTIETCDGKDNDCNGKVDDGLSRGCTTACGIGEQTCSNGAYGACSARQPTAEACDGLDNDCDGEVDGPTAICPGGATCVSGICQPLDIGGGCDCQVGAASAPPWTPFGLAALVALLLLARRRR